MQVALNVTQMVVAIVLIIAVILQNKGAGLSGAFGPQAGVFRTRRGLERILFRLTIVLAVLFLAVSLLNVRFHGVI